MTDRPIFDHINELSSEEERLVGASLDGRRAEHGGPGLHWTRSRSSWTSATTCCTSGRLAATPAWTPTRPRSARPRSWSATSSRSRGPTPRPWETETCGYLVVADRVMR